MGRLRDAIASGWNNVQGLKSNRRFDSLSARDDFKKLVSG